MGIMFAYGSYNIHADTGPLTTWLGFAFMILSIVGMVLRVYAKRCVGQGFFKEDWVLLVAFAFSLVLYAAAVCAVSLGNMGRHMAVTDQVTFSRFLRALYVIQMTYTISLAITKFSIILMYRRLFKVHKSNFQLLIFEYISWLRLIATVLVYIFPCTPVNAFWDKAISGKCIVNLEDLYIVSAVWNIFTDIALLYFPLPIIWSLQLYRRQKLAVYSFFVCAASVTLISIIRLVSVVQVGGSHDTTWVISPVAVWSVVETGLAIFCACIPSMRPLLQVFTRHHRTPINTSPSNPHLHKKWWGPNIHENAAHFQRMKGGIEEPFELYGPRTLITAQRRNTENALLGDGGIHVQHEVQIEHQIHADTDDNSQRDLVTSKK